MAVPLTHPDRELWPGITKQDLADYWQSVADRALPEIADRPLALVRCPEGIGGAHFFQKHRSPGFPAAIQQGEAEGSPFLFIRDTDGLRACAQIAEVRSIPSSSRRVTPTRIMVSAAPEKMSPRSVRPKMATGSVTQPGG